MTDQLPAILAHYGLELSRDHGSFTVTAICHEDAHKSASVNLDHGLYNCFTCSWGGDAYTVVQHMEGCTFSEAKRIVETVAGTGGGEVRGSVDGDTSGYRIPRRKGDQSSRRKYVPSWRR